MLINVDADLQNKIEMVFTNEYLYILLEVALDEVICASLLLNGSRFCISANMYGVRATIF